MLLKTYHHDSCQEKGTSSVGNVGIGCGWCDLLHSCHYGDIDILHCFAVIDGKSPKNHLKDNSVFPTLIPLYDGKNEKLGINNNKRGINILSQGTKSQC